jgi:protein-S-isoprenylcysteine O-methyltransferase Ste14
MRKLFFAVFGLLSYAVFFGSFLYSIGFLTNRIVPKSIDSGEPVALLAAATVNVLLVSLFALQHSVMARAGFKRWLTRFVPEPIERSTYVLLSGLVFFLIFWQWQPMTGIVWNIDGPIGSSIVMTLFGAGLALVVISSYLVSHFDLFGLRQIYLHLRKQEYTYVSFKTPALYKIVRHPIMLGYLIVFWATPCMTTGHLLLALGMTIYILAGLHFEERDLVAAIGQEYKEYRQRVPMLIPFFKKSS